MPAESVPCAFIEGKQCSNPLCVWLYYSAKAEFARKRLVDSMFNEVKAIHDSR